MVCWSMFLTVGRGKIGRCWFFVPGGSISVHLPTEVIIECLWLLIFTNTSVVSGAVLEGFQISMRFK